MNKRQGPFGQEYRLRFIEKVIANYGTISRDFIGDYFGISIPQVSLDIQAYGEIAPGNIVFDTSAKSLVCGAKFKRVFK
jgi:hypothetical protein